MKRVGLIFGLIILIGSVLAQDSDQQKQVAIDQIIELVSENLETEDLDFTTVLEDLNYFYDHPLNLNKAERGELQRLYALDDFQIRALQRHIKLAGKLISMLELQGIDGFDLRTLEAIGPFVKVLDKTTESRLNGTSIKQEASHEAIIRYQRVLEEMVGFAPIDDSTLSAKPDSRYLGDAARIYTRYRFRFLKNLSAGITAEKDPGEEFFTGTQKLGFDYYSAHIYLGNQGVIKHAIIGDYQIEFGQGLTYWTGLAFGKSADIKSIKRNGRGIAPYVSADENNFMRGAATTLQIGSVEITAFGSSKMLDANKTVIDTLDEEFQVSEFSSLQTSGIHGTPSQLFDKDAVRETNFGGNVKVSLDDHHIGATFVQTNYGSDFGGLADLYRKFEGRSGSFYVAGLDYQFLIRNILGFGEASFRSDGGTAYINGAIMSLDQTFNISILHRNYSKGYFSPRSNAISESSRNSNEEGLYFGLEAKMSKAWRFNAYYDLFTFPWLRFRTDIPSYGKEYLGQLEYRPNKAFKAYARYRMEEKQENYQVENLPSKSVNFQKKQWFRINAQYAFSKTFSIRNRLEYLFVNQPERTAESGWMMYQDFIWKPTWPARYELKFRYALFDTDGYDSRIYTYEHDVLYAFSVPAYYNRGSRAYLIGKYDLSRWSELTVRLSQTFYADRNQIGSGLNEIDGSTRTEVKAQLRVKF
ncbi:MAG: hypothetical protein HOG66_08375 [Flavobacteriales bacterium]|nr:hypothetical protein [Flavobacteriales bacterium]